MNDNNDRFIFCKDCVEYEHTYPYCDKCISGNGFFSKKTAKKLEQKKGVTYVKS